MKTMKNSAPSSHPTREAENEQRYIYAIVNSTTDVYVSYSVNALNADQAINEIGRNICLINPDTECFEKAKEVSQSDFHVCTLLKELLQPGILDEYPRSKEFQTILRNATIAVDCYSVQPLKVVGYRSRRGYAKVKARGFKKAWKRSLRIKNSSPTGPEWGYPGSGPSQLALSLLLWAGTDRRRSERLFSVFRAEKIEALPRTGFEFTKNEIRFWVRTKTAAHCG